MDIAWARNMYKTMSIYDIPMRVVHYDRVSSDSDEQLNSLNNQNLFNEEMIKNNPNWTYVGKYVDEGISGISTKNRKDFNRLIQDAKAGLFDFVVTKEISRFARNILDSIRYTRELLQYGVCVFFQNDNINTIEEDSEFRLAIMASVAQEESRKLSSRVRYGHSVSIKNGVILGHDIYGYVKKDKKSLEYDEHYKPMIEFIFQKYANEELSTNKLSDVLYEMGYRSFKGGKIDSNVIKHIIRNPKYKGYYCGKKVQITNMFTKKQKFLTEDEWIMYKDYESIPPIISEELWERANFILNKRGSIVKSRNTSLNNLENKFTGKIICSEDGEAYWLKSKTSRNKRIPGDNPKWQCHQKSKKASTCNSIAMYENELLPIIMDIINKVDLTDDVIKEYIELYKTITSNDDSQKQISSLKADIVRINLKKDKILDYNLDGKISDIEFEKRNNDFNKQLEEIELQLEKLMSNGNIENNLDDLLKNINHIFSQIKNVTPSDLNRRMIDKLFEKIIARPISKTQMELTFVLRNGETESAFYPAYCKDDFMLQSGHITKTIVPKCNKTFARNYNKYDTTKYFVTFDYSAVLIL